MRSIDYRRHQMERAKARARRVLTLWFRHYPKGKREALLAEGQRVGLQANTRCLCSEWCCGNPRRHFGEVTMQERRASLLDEEV